MPKKIEGVLTSIKVSILHEILKCRQTFQASSTNELSRRVGRRVSTVHYHLVDLTRWGYVVRGNKNEAQVAMWTLTEKGASLFNDAQVNVEIAGSGKVW